MCRCANLPIKIHSTVNYQLLTIHYQLSTINEKRTWKGPFSNPNLKCSYKNLVTVFRTL
jgi:hypothetical protein